MAKGAIAINLRGGLCNRLHTIMVYLAYANKKNKKLKILWETDRPQDRVVSHTHFLDVFEPLPGASFIRSIASVDSKKLSYYVGHGNGCGELLKEAFGKGNQLKALNYSYSLLKLNPKLQDEAEDLVRPHLNILEPWPRIITYIFSDYISIHVRRTDHVNWLKKRGASPTSYFEFERFIEKYSGNDFLIFGFTHEVFQTFFDKIKKNNKYDLRNGILIHGGGWKKLKNKKISNEKFKKNFLKEYNLNKVFNYYGLIEQIGSIFFECPVCSLFVCSNFSEIFIRDKNLNIIKNGKGFVQLLSLLPKSYPGHNILTEDIGEIIQNPNCKFDHKGKCFKIHGRVENSVIRGCSDV